MKNVALPISNLPIGPVSRTPSPCRGTERGRARTNRKSIVATAQLIARARFETIESPPSRCVLLRFRETSPASRLNHGSVPRVICSVVELVVLIVARVSKAILTICRERDNLSIPFRRPVDYCKETTGIGRLQYCCCSCNVREQTACTFISGMLFRRVCECGR